VTYVDRATWKAAPPRRAPHRPNPAGIRLFIVHHTTPDELNIPNPLQAVQSIQRFHQNTRGWNDIAYNFLVDRFGTLYEGRGWGIAGGHTNGYNTVSIGVAFLGDGDEVLRHATPALHTIRALADEADTRLGRRLARHAHRNFGTTHCAGNYLSDWAVGGMPLVGKPSGPSKAPVTPPTIRSGATGPLVRWAQARLIEHGEPARLLKKEIEWNTFGPATRKAVQAFQLRNGLKVDGIIGPNTWVPLDSGAKTDAPAPKPADEIPAYPGVLRRGATGVGVQQVQWALNSRHGQRLKGDGSFGPATESAIRGFQRSQGINVDGIVGQVTWHHLWR
jgi:peptidoglycan hydrolase-like protein with peptidoglycan-binding domain